MAGRRLLLVLLSAFALASPAHARSTTSAAVAPAVPASPLPTLPQSASLDRDQAIQNFVAGLILLAGRSIRVGDWISVGGQDGDVQRINVRATEIRMVDKSVLIVPNSDLVSKTVRNVTWNDPLGVVGIGFTLGWEIDPDQVSALVLEVLGATPGVLKDPAPSVALTEFKDVGAAFSATAYVQSPRAVFRAKSDILFELSRRMRAAGITPGGAARTATVEGPGSGAKA